MRMLFAAVGFAAGLYTCSARAETTPILCAKDAGGGIWTNLPAGSGQFMTMLVPNNSGAAALYAITWEMPGLVWSQSPERYGTLNLGYFGIFLAAGGFDLPPLQFALYFEEARTSTKPKWLGAQVRTDLVPGGQTADLVLTLDRDSREWRWPYEQQAIPGQSSGSNTGSGSASFQDPPDEMLEAISTARTMRLILRSASGAELARLEGTLPNAEEWSKLRTEQVGHMVGLANTRFEECPSRIPFWFKWEDLKAGRVPFLSGGPPRRLDPTTGEPIADDPPPAAQ